MNSKACITSLATAVPAHRISNDEASKFMLNVLPLNEMESRKVKAIYRASGNQYRYSVVQDFTLQSDQFEFFSANGTSTDPMVGQRMHRYRKEALPLALQAIANMKRDHLNKEITHLVTVSCTGMYAPGLDIDIVQALSLSGNVHRTCINFMGCYAAINAMKTADQIVSADRDAKVLVVCVELCSLHFQKKTDDDSLLSNALFGDGAAAMVVEAQAKEALALGMESFQCELLPEGSSDMAWHIGDQAFEMRLSAYVPQLIQSGLDKLWSQAHRGREAQASFYAIHPGGKRILEALEKSLGLSKEDHRFSYDILRRYGNMSSPTVLFVLKAIWDELKTADAEKRIMAMAFGPGLTVEMARLKVLIP